MGGLNSNASLLHEAASTRDGARDRIGAVTNRAPDQQEMDIRSYGNNRAISLFIPVLFRPRGKLILIDVRWAGRSEEEKGGRFPRRSPLTLERVEASRAQFNSGKRATSEPNMDA
ncbi:unnamed protein product [Boreogadus saida]